LPNINWDFITGKRKLKAGDVVVSGLINIWDQVKGKVPEKAYSKYSKKAPVEGTHRPSGPDGLCLGVSPDIPLEFGRVNIGDPPTRGIFPCPAAGFCFSTCLGQRRQGLDLHGSGAFSLELR
jgi:hypothetical protein